MQRSCSATAAASLSTILGCCISIHALQLHCTQARCTAATTRATTAAGTCLQRLPQAAASITAATAAPLSWCIIPAVGGHCGLGSIGNRATTRFRCWWSLSCRCCTLTVVQVCANALAVTAGVVVTTAWRAWLIRIELPLSMVGNKAVSILGAVALLLQRRGICQARRGRRCCCSMTTTTTTAAATSTATTTGAATVTATP